MDEQTKTDAVFQGLDTEPDIFDGNGDECRFFLESIHEQIEETEADLAVRREEDRLKYRKRFGLRSKKDFPFPNAANFSLRLADKIIRKLKPHYFSLVSGVDGQKAELVRSPGMDEATYLKTANVMNYILNLAMPDFEPLMWIAIDKAMMYDFVVLSPYWRRELKTRTCVLDMDSLIERSAIADVYALIRMGLESGQTKGLRERVTSMILVCLNDMGITLDPEDEKDVLRLELLVDGIFRGEKRFEFDYEAVVENRNAMRVIEPSDFVVARHVKHIQSAELICEKMYFTPVELRRCRDEGKFDALACDELFDSFDARTGVMEAGFGTMDSGSKNAAQNRSGLIPVRKVCCYAPIGRNGLLRRCVMFYSPDYMERPLAVYAFESEKWPYVQLKIEVLDEGFYSPRGIVSMVDTFDRVINSQFNDMLNRRLITTTPMLTHIPTKVYPSNIRYIPGQSIPVKEQGAVRPLIVGANADVTYERGILFIRAWAEDFMGVPDFAISSGQRGNGSSRTATELHLLNSLKDVLVEMDARVFNQSLEELFELFFLQWLENADKHLELMIDGGPIRISKDDIVPNPKFKVNGTFARTNRHYQRQQALQRLEVFKGDPFINQYALRKQALMLDGDGMADKLLRKEDEILRQVRLESLLGDENLKNAHKKPQGERSGNGTQS